MLAIEIVNLTKQYKNGTKALNSFNLQVKKGEIFSLLGPNGAGKSSLIHILTTYCQKTNGIVTILGKDIDKESEFIRTQIACVAQHTSIDMHLSLKENMIVQANLYHIDSSTAKKRREELIQCFELEQYLNYPVISYSGGIKRRLDIAMSMMSQPQILFLDEPTVGMDIQSRTSMWKMMKRIQTNFNTTIFLTTHYLEEADQLSDTICIMKEGHEMIQGTPQTLYDYMHQDCLRIGFHETVQIENCIEKLKKEFKIDFTPLQNNSIMIRTKNSLKDLLTINKWLLEQNICFTAIEIVQPRLEDIFLSLTDSNRKEVHI